MTSPDARLARLEAQLVALRDDVGELRQESVRTRGRLHDIEGIAGTLVDQEKALIRATKQQQDAMKIRLQLLTVVVALAALLEPFLYHVAIGG